MDGASLCEARKKAGLTQMEAAEKLGVSQTLLSLMEKDKRSVTGAVALKAVQVLRASPAFLPVSLTRRHSDEQLAADLAALGYPGFSYLKGGPRNPAEVLLDALDRENLDARLVEALPWLALQYPDIDWSWLGSQARLRNRQNRVGFVVNLGAKIARLKARRAVAKKLYRVLREFREARLLKNDTLCQAYWPPSQRRHVHSTRSKMAAYWNIDTRLTEQDLAYLPA